MQFVVLAYDDTEAGTLDRRMAVRAEHLEGIKAMVRDGRVVDGGMVTDDTGKAIGSVLLCDFADRAALDAYLANDVYTRAKVWKDVTVLNLRRIGAEILAVRPKSP